eukprot:Ihof_evm4s657 gene=Ihof_evmTU4s657
MSTGKTCDSSSPDYLGGYKLANCELPVHAKREFWKIQLEKKTKIRHISLRLQNPSIGKAAKFNLRVGDKKCGEVVQKDGKMENFEIACPDGGIEGHHIHWDTEQIIPDDFKYCDFVVCGGDDSVVPTPVVPTPTPTPVTPVTKPD